MIRIRVRTPILMGAIGFFVELGFGLAGLVLGLLPAGVGLIRLVIAPASVLWLASPESVGITLENLMALFIIGFANGVVYFVIALLVLGVDDRLQDRASPPASRGK